MLQKTSVWLVFFADRQGSRRSICLGALWFTAQKQRHISGWKTQAWRSCRVQGLRISLDPHEHERKGNTQSSEPFKEAMPAQQISPSASPHFPIPRLSLFPGWLQQNTDLCCSRGQLLLTAGCLQLREACPGVRRMLCRSLTGAHSTSEQPGKEGIAAAPNIPPQTPSPRGKDRAEAMTKPLMAHCQPTEQADVSNEVTE